MAIFSAIGGIIAGFGTWFAGLGVGTQIALRIIGGLGFNALSRALAGDPEQPAPPGIIGTLQQGADVSRAFWAGRRAIAGSLVYHNQWGGAENEFYTRITALSDLPVTGLVAIVVDGETYQIDFANPHADRGFPIIGLDTSRTETERVQTGTHPDHGTPVYTLQDVVVNDPIGWVKFYDGTQTTADQFVIDNVSTPERPWTAQDVGVGVAYAITTFQIDREVFQGLPELLFIGDGIAMEDVNAQTTGHSENPIVMAHQILKGLTFNGQWFYGPQTGARVDTAETAAEIAKCDLPPEGSDAMTDAEKTAVFGSTTVPARYRASIEIRVDRPVAEVLEDIMSACNGRISDVGTRYRLQVGDPAATVADLTDDDFLRTAQQSFAPFFPLAETINGITATYPDPAQGWQMQDAPPLYRPDLEELDGHRRLPTGVVLTAVPFPEQVQRLMAAALDEARRAARLSGVLSARFAHLEVGDFVTLTSQRYGYTNKVCRIDGVSDLPNGDRAADLTEVDPTDYQINALTNFRPIQPGALSTVVNPPAVVTGWTVEPYVVTDATNTARRPALALSWTPPARDAYAGLAWQVRETSSGRLVDEGTAGDPRTGLAFVSAGLVANTSYQARGKFLRNGPSNWTAWTAATTPDVRLSAGDLTEALNNTIATAQQEANDAFNDVQQVITDVSDIEDDLGTFAAAHVGLTVDLDGNGAIAGIRATSYAVPDGQGASLLELLGTVVKVGTLTFDRLVSGAGGKNEIQNARFEAGLVNWTAQDPDGTVGAQSTVQLRLPGETWAGETYPTVYIAQAGTATDGYANLYASAILEDGTIDNRAFPVEPGRWYGAAAKVGARRANGVIFIIWRDATGAFLGATASNATDASSFNAGSPSSVNPETWPDAWTHGQAPAGAVFGQVIFRKFGTLSASDSFLFVHKPHTFRSHAGATEPPDFSPEGVVLIHGGQVVANSVTAEKMDVIELSAIAAQIGTVQSLNYAQDGNGLPTAGFRLDGPNDVIKGVDFVDSRGLVTGAALIERYKLIEGVSVTDDGDTPDVVVAAFNMPFQAYSAELDPENPLVLDVEVEVVSTTSATSGTVYFRIERSADGISGWTAFGQTKLASHPFHFSVKWSGSVSARDTTRFFDKGVAGIDLKDFPHLRIVAFVSSIGANVHSADVIRFYAEFKQVNNNI